MRRIITSVLCLLLGGCAAVPRNVATNAATAAGSGDPRESFLYRNFVGASEVLDRALAAHGGAELLDRAVDLRISFTGALRYQGHYPRPWAYKDYSLEGITLYSAELRAVKSEQTFTADGKPQPTFTIVGTTNGLKRDGGGSPEAIPEAELGKALRAELELLPHEYLRQARAGAAGLRLLSGSDGHDVVGYTLDDGEARALFFDADTHLLMRVERVGHWEHKGDRLERRTFSDYVERSGIRIPQRSDVHVEESSTQYDLTTEITSIDVGAVVQADEIAIPEAFRAGFEEWKLEGPKADALNELLPSHDLGNGAFVIELPSADARSLLVAFSDFAVVVEAGDSSEISTRILATADHMLPGKPVRYVAMTHHHPLYTGGLRPYVQRGVTVLATAGDVAYYRDLATRPYRIHPDEQQRNPRELKLEVIDGTRVIEDGTQRLELYEFDYSTHTDEFVLPYLPSHKLIVTGDAVYVLRDAELRPANSREKAIHRVVQEHQLDVEQIMQTWFLESSDHVVPYAVLEEKIRLAEAQDAKKP